MSLSAFLPFRFPLLSRSFAGALTGWLLAAALTAKPLPVPFASEYQAENWSFEDGYPENSCTGLVTGPDGYLWIGTFRGLLRFNGQSFRPWTPDKVPALRSTPVYAMYRDRSGRIWLSTMEGLWSVSGSTWRHWAAPEGWDHSGGFVRSFAENESGTLVLGQSTGRVYRLEGDRFRELPLPPGTGGTLASLDAGGSLYVVRVGGTSYLHEGSWQPLPGEPGLSAAAVGATSARDGHAVLFTRSHLLRVRDGRVVSRLPLSTPVNWFWQADEDGTGALWLSGLESGVYRVGYDGHVRHFRKADGLPHSGGTRFVRTAPDDTVWIGGGVGGLTRFRPTRFRYLGESEGLGEREVLTLARLDDDRGLFSPYASGLKVVDAEGRIEPLQPGLLAPYFTRSLLRTGDGSIWFGTYGSGLHRLENGRIVPVATEFFPPAEKDSVHALFEDSRGRLWIGGERRVLRHDAGRFEAVALPDSSVGRRPTLFAERADGTVLVGQHEDLYACAGGGLAPVLLARFPPLARISTLLVDRRDRLWVGTADHGLFLVRDGTPHRIPLDRLPDSDRIAALVQDDDGLLWFGAGHGILRADPDELVAALADRSREPRLVRFNRDDGLRDIDFTYGTQPNVIKDARGRLWFALIRGAGVVDPRAVRVNDRPPPVVVEAISYVPEGSRRPVVLPVVAGAPPPILPAGSRLIRIDYAALDFSAPRKQRFRAALDADWQDLQGETTVSFLELPPGTRTFRVQAAGSDGMWNREGATLRFELAPFYWQTWWFRTSVAAALLGLVAGGVWLAGDRRTRQARLNLERERHLAEARARLAHVLENTSDVVAFVDLSGRLTYLNRAGRALLGLDPDADSGTRSLDTLQPLWARERHTREALPAATRHGTWSGESALLAASGATVPVSQVLVAHRAADGRVDFVSMIARDISAMKRQAAIQDALRQLAIALTAALEPPSLGRAAAAACRTLFAHDGFALTLLDDRGAVAATPHADPAADLPTSTGITVTLPPLAPLLEGRSLLFNGEPPAGSGTPAVPAAMHAPVRWEGHTLGVVSVASRTLGRFSLRDLENFETIAHHCAAALARLEAEARIRRQEAQLRQSQRLESVGTLAGGIAHDFNNILTAVLGNVELAGFPLPPDHPSRGFLAKIEQSSLRARDLVRRILAFSRPPESTSRSAIVAQVVDEVVHLLRSTAPAGIDIASHLDPSAVAEIDSSELHQVLLNLGTNAVHALGAGPGRLEFAVRPFELVPGSPPPAPDLAPGLHVRIVVSDTGPGIPPDILPRIFDPFFTTKPVGQGTGLGLSVAHGIVRAHRGAIAVAPRPGGGTTFTVFLRAAFAPDSRPAPHPEAPPAPPPSSGPLPAAPAPAPAGPTGRIAIVDDETMITNALRLLFSRSPFDVVTYNDPRELVAEFERDPAGFDLVLTDLSMPGLDGIALAGRLRALCPDLPIILFSGNIEPAARVAATAAGIAEMVEKPASPRTLFPLVERLIAARRARR